MSLKLSTALVNYMTGEGHLRKCFEDCIMEIYSTTPPATADAAVTGTLLCTIVKSSTPPGAGDRSTKTLYAATIGTGHTEGSTVKANITVDGVGPTTYTYTILAADDTDAKVAVKVARMLDDIPQLSCIPTGSTGAFYLQSRVAGLDFTLADGGGTYMITPGSKVITAARVNTIQFGPPTVGAISKNSDVWSGVNVATGVASYFRFCLPNDPHTLDSSYIYPRIQGTIAPSGSDLDMSNTSLTKDATTTIDNYTLTLPKSA
jgi:hypothetical protein